MNMSSIFFGDNIQQYQGIKRYKDIPEDRFHVIKFNNYKGLIFQHGLMRLATDKDFSKIIILADPHFVMSLASMCFRQIAWKKIIYGRMDGLKI